jgi:hypothetical protein
MEILNLPEYQFRIREDKKGKKYIFDPYRKKELLLTPEEWVRLNIIRYLIEEKGYPAGLISAEAGIKFNKLSRRYDVLLYNQKGQPVMLIECKAPGVTINQNVFDQVVAYNSFIRAGHLLVTNGIKHFCCRISPGGERYLFLEKIPFFDELD